MHLHLHWHCRVLPRNQICLDKWPTEFEKDGPFQKIWGPRQLPIHDSGMVFQHLDKLKGFRNCETIHNVCIRIRCFENTFEKDVLKITDNL